MVMPQRMSQVSSLKGTAFVSYKDDKHCDGILAYTRETPKQYGFEPSCHRKEHLPES